MFYEEVSQKVLRRVFSVPGCLFVVTLLQDQGMLRSNKHSPVSALLELKLYVLVWCDINGDLIMVLTCFTSGIKQEETLKLFLNCMYT